MNYQIFGRKIYAEPLKLLGQINAKEGEALSALTLEKFGGEGWVELIALPQQHIITVIAPSQEVEA